MRNLGKGLPKHLKITKALRKHSVSHNAMLMISEVVQIKNKPSDFREFKLTYLAYLITF